MADEREGARGGMDEEGLEKEVKFFAFFFFWNSERLMGVSVMTDTMHFLTEAIMSRSLEPCCTCDLGK